MDLYSAFRISWPIWVKFGIEYFPSTSWNSHKNLCSDWTFGLMKLGFHKIRQISWLAEDLLASKEVLYSMK